MARPGDRRKDRPRDDVIARAIPAARAGDEEGWRAIYDRLSPVVLGYLRARRAPNPEDLTGEVFVQIVRDFDRFEGGGADLRAWVMKIAHNRLIDARRAAARRPEPAPLEDAGPLRGGDVAEEGMSQVSGQRVLRVLESLSEDQRTVLTLRIIADLTVEQTARAIGKRPGAVKALQRRALKKIAREFEEKA